MPTNLKTQGLCRVCKQKTEIRYALATYGHSVWLCGTCRQLLACLMRRAGGPANLERDLRYAEEDISKLKAEIEILKEEKNVK